jgi:hypothetical protein
MSDGAEKAHLKLDTVQQQKATATALLETLRGEMPEDMHSREAVEIESPVLRLLEASLLEIETNGGKIDPQMIGMLSTAGNLADVLDHVWPKDRDKDPSYFAKPDIAQICGEMAEQLMSSGLVALPVVSPARGVARR